MAEDNSISDNEVIAFSEKLEAWSNALPPKEQQMLHMMLTAPTALVAETAEVQGYAAPTYAYALQGDFWSLYRSWQYTAGDPYIKDDFKHGWVNSPRGMFNPGIIQQ